MLLAAGAVNAQADDSGQKIHRCLGKGGEVVFSGLPCDGSGTMAASNTAPSALTAPPADACITSRDALRERTGRATAAHDANALAGLMRWRGVDARTAAGRLGLLHDLVKRPLLALDAQADSDEDPASIDGVLRVRTGGDDSGAMREHTFGLDTDGHCHWLVW